jgi:hypothetical protein
VELAAQGDVEALIALMAQNRTPSTEGINPEKGHWTMTIKVTVAAI